MNLSQKISRYSEANLGKFPRDVYIDNHLLAPLIDVPETGSFIIHPQGQEKEVGVTVNKDAIAESLLTIAQEVDPENGARRIYSFLEKRVLKIRFKHGRSSLRPKNGGVNGREYGLEGATATPALSLLWGGPKITFNEPYLESYFAAKKSGDYLRTKHEDLLVLEELVHTYQDARNPRDHLASAARYNSQEIASVFGNGFNREKDLIEAEARDLVEEIVLDKLVNVGLGKSKPEQEFGRFFSFS